MLPAGVRWPDISFRWLALLAAGTIGLLIVLVGWELYQGSRQAISQFGPKFLVSSTWNPVTDHYGAWPFIYGTLVSSLIALIIAVPLGVATALYLTELAPVRIRQPVIMIVEMLAAVPSVIFGLWGIFVLDPLAAGPPVRLAEEHARLPAAVPGADLWREHARRRHRRGDHDPADHHLGFARDSPLGPQPAAGGGLCAWGPPIGR